MPIRLITVANRQPGWVSEAYADYSRRLDRGCRLELIEVALARRSGKADAPRALADESRRVLKHVPDGAHVVALAVDGQAWSTAELARRLEGWLARPAPVVLLVGGPDGLGPECLSRAAERWSLSALTLPHGLVRIVVAEALYRARSLARGHPYHRG